MEYLVDVVPCKRLPRSLRFFTYRLSDALADPRACLGAFVRIPFRREQLDAIVWQRRAKKPAGVQTLLPVTAVLPVPPLTDLQRNMLSLFADHYAISPGHAAYRMLPRIPHRHGISREQEYPSAPLPPQLPASRMREILAVRTRRARPRPLFIAAASLAERAGIALAAARRQRGQLLIVVPTLVELDQFAAALDHALQRRLLVLDPRLPLAAYWERWQRVANKGNAVILSLTDGVFAPVRHLSAIIVDQASDPQHHHAEQNPRFQTLTVVNFLARLAGSSIIALDAAPTLGITRLPRLRTLGLRPSPQHRSAIDLQNERTRKSFAPLAEAVQEHVAARAGRTLFFLNRRGLRRSVHCKECGWTAFCPRCRLPQTLHAGASLQCHHCGLASTVPARCPACAGAEFSTSGMGTEFLTSYLRTRFPHRPVQRIDRDTDATTVNAAPDALVVATERIGYLPVPEPFATIVHVQVDTLLQVADYRIEEQAYLLSERICTLAGPDAAIFFQTYRPDQPVIRALLRRTWRDFYTHELEVRRALQLPPAVPLIKLIGKGTTRASVEQRAAALQKQLQAQVSGLPELHVTGPFLPQPERNGRWYRRFLLLRVLSGKQRLATLHRVLHSLPDDWLADVDPVSLLQ